MNKFMMIIATLMVTASQLSPLKLNRPTQFAPVFVIHIEYLDSDAAYRRDSHDHFAALHEMFGLNLRARIEERNKLVALATGDIWSFMKIAPVARKTKV